MTLEGLNLPDPSTIGKIITCTVEGILEIDDLLAIATGAGVDPSDIEAAQPREAEDPSDLKRVKERHHSVARLIAQGMPQSVVASIAGYQESYLSVLLNNPAMQELIGFYRTRTGGIAEVITENLKTVGLKAVEKLNQRLDATGEDAMDDNALVAVAKLGLDRAGHGPQTKAHVVNEHHLLDYASIAELNLDAKRKSSEYIVPVADVRRVALPAITTPKAES